MLAVTIIGTFFLAVAAIAAAIGALKTAKASRAALIAALLNDYWSDEYRVAAQGVRVWQKQRGDDFADSFQQLWVKQARFSGGEKETFELIEPHRRRVKGYFQKAYELAQAGYVKEKDARDVLCTPVRVELLLEVIEPLEPTERYRPHEGLYDFFDKLHGRKLVRPRVRKS
jgi:hypothetical protein